MKESEMYTECIMAVIANDEVKNRYKILKMLYKRQEIAERYEKEKKHFVEVEIR